MKISNYKFYLNPHNAYAFTQCPKCEQKTKVRTYCLMVHYQEGKEARPHLLSINKSCKFCPYCELIIAKKAELEPIIQQNLRKLNRDFNPDAYFTFGTLDKEDWKRVQKGDLNAVEAFNLSHRFKEVVDFEVLPAGWYFEGEINRRTRARSHNKN